MTRALKIQVGFAVLALLLAVGMYAYAYHAVEKESSTAASLITDIQAKTLASVHVAQAKKALSTLTPEEASVNSYFVAPDDIVTFLENLQKTGSDLGANVTVVSVTNDPDGSHAHLVLSLQITGSFDSVLRTVGAIEYGPYDSMVKNLTLDSTAGDKGTQWMATGVFLIGTKTASSTLK